MKVLHLVRNIEYEGGAEIFIRAFLKKLIGNFGVGIYCLEGIGKNTDDLASRGVEVFDARGDWFNPNSALKLNTLIQDKGYDILHTHLFNADFVGGMVKAINPAQTIVSTKYCMESRFTEKNNLFERLITMPLCNGPLERFTSQKVDEVYAVSSAVGNKWKKLSKRFFVFPCSPHEVSDIKPKEDYSSDGEITIGTFARLVPEKGIIEGIEAIKEVAKQINVKWNIYGDGFLRDELVKNIQESSLENRIILRGHMHNEELFPHEMNLIDIYFHPSRSEGLSIAIQEAMSVGLPIVSTDVGGSQDMIRDRFTGLLCNKLEPINMAQALIEVCSDKKLREYLGRNARKLAEEKFNLGSVVKQYLERYGNLI